MARWLTSAATYSSRAFEWASSLWRLNFAINVEPEELEGDGVPASQGTEDAQLLTERGWAGEKFETAEPVARDIWTKALPGVHVPDLDEEGHVSAEGVIFVHQDGDITYYLMNPSDESPVHAVVGLSNPYHKGSTSDLDRVADWFDSLTNGHISA